MAVKYVLKLRTSSPPHLYLDTIKGWLLKDKVLHPQTRKILLLMKKWKRSFVQLPLQMEVIISDEYRCNLERALSPALMPFTKTEWNEEDIERYANNKKTFFESIRNLYNNNMGYDIEEESVDINIIPKIIADIDSREKALKDKIEGKKPNSIDSAEKQLKAQKQPEKPIESHEKHAIQQKIVPDIHPLRTVSSGFQVPKLDVNRLDISTIDKRRQKK